MPNDQQGALQELEHRGDAVLWDTEHDTYTVRGSEVLDEVTEAIAEIIAPLMAGWADAAHVGAIVNEAAQRAVTQEWNRRQDHP